MAVDDPAAGRPEPVCPAAARHDDDVGVWADPPGSPRQQRQRRPVVAAQHGDAVERRRDDPGTGELRVGPRRVVERRVEGGVREGREHGKHDSLGTTSLGEVVVGDAHGGAWPRIPADGNSIEHAAHLGNPLAPGRHRGVYRRQGRVGRVLPVEAREDRQDRGRKVGRGGDGEARHTGVREASDRGGDDRPRRSCVFVALDGVETVGERRDDMRDEQHIGVAQVVGDGLGRPRPEQQHAGGAERCGVGRREWCRPHAHDGGPTSECASGGRQDAEVHPVGVNRPDVEGGAPGRQVSGPARIPLV